MKNTRKPITIGEAEVAPGTQQIIDLPVAGLYTHTDMTMPVKVIHGRRSGPHLFVCAAIHGSEINGVEIIRRLLQLKLLRSLRGTLIAVPVVNVYGFINKSRYLPDRRDLNRSFPGSGKGSLTSRLAKLFMDEVAEKCTHGIDLHTGASHRSNLPQVRACLDDEQTECLARAFGAPVIINSSLRDGSLREAVREKGIPMLLYEGGGALRFNEAAIRTGVRGILNVMREIGMLSKAKRRELGTSRQKSRLSNRESVVVEKSTWVRASESGLLRGARPLGTKVEKGDVLGFITDPFSENEVEVTAHATGIIIGRTYLPLVNEGGALFHIARLDNQVDISDVLLDEADYDENSESYTERMEWD